MRILVATEDRSERAVIRGALAHRSTTDQVLYVEDGVDAYLALRRDNPDLAIVSAGLPRVDGIVLVRTVVRSVALQRTRTILVLTPTCATRVREALAARPAGLLVRPFGFETFLDRMERVLAQPDVAAGIPGQVPISRQT
jgi:DNA-binding NarL/FixJ family response regulator